LVGHTVDIITVDAILYNMRVISFTLSLWFLIALLLSGCSTMRDFGEGFSGHSAQFIENHAPTHVIVKDRVYPTFKHTRSN